MWCARIQKLVGLVGVSALLGTAVTWGQVLARIDEHETRLGRNASVLAANAEAIGELGRQLAVTVEQARAAREAAEAARSAAQAAAMTSARTAGNVETMLELVRARR